MTLRLAFMGSPDFSVPTLDALVEAGHEIVRVYTQPPKPAGRGKRLRPTPVQLHAEALGLPVTSPKSLKAPEAAETLAALRLDALVVIAYGLILPPPILAATRLGAMNLHGSTLPRWRGAAPIQRAIMAGDQTTGVDAMVMEAGLDTGPVIASQTCRIFPLDTAADLHDRLAGLAAELAPRALAGWASGDLAPQLQPEEGMTYAHKITPEDQPIDWTRPAAQIDCQIRGLAPAPGAFFHWRPAGADAPVRLKVLLSGVVRDAQAGALAGAPGEVLALPGLAVACGSGAVEIKRLQRPGKGPMDAADFLRGTPIAPGTRFS
ncbi:MAG: methionyl-tRNA formyltransferase [Pseudomonadota bacterium]